MVIVYLGGAMGVQAWLIKGFFDTIPVELDESARVDGATPAQIFWGVVLPLAAPVLAVVALISFVFTLNEFVIASALLQTTSHLTLPVGMQPLVNDQYDQTWGPFTAGALLAAVPVAILFLFLQRWIVSGLTAGRGQGMTLHGATRSLARSSTQPHHDGSELYVSSGRGPGRATPSCACACRAWSGRARVLRYDARRRAGRAEAVHRRRDRDRRRGGAPTSRSTAPVTRYRWLLSGGDVGYAWVNGLGRVAHEVPDADDFVHRPGGGRPGLASRRRSSTRSSPTVSRRAGVAVEPPDWAVAAPWDDAPEGPRAATPRRALRRRPARASSSTSTTSSRSART